MTEQRLYEILNRVHGDKPHHESHLIIEAMKQAVNEALGEAAEKAEAYKESRFPSVHYCDCCPVVDKQSLLNLKLCP